MKKTAAFRFTADLCFYFSILSIFPAMRAWMLPMALFAAAFLVVSLIAVHVPWAALRLLLALLPGLCFIGAEIKPLLVFPALGWLYMIIVLTSGRFHIWLDEYRRIYRVMLVIVLCSLAANAAHSAIYRGDVISYPSLIYAFCFLCLGVIAMRGIQMNANMSFRWRLANAAAVVGVPLLAFGGSVLIYMLLRFTAPGLNYVLKPVGRFVDWLILAVTPEKQLDPTTTPIPMPSTPPSISLQIPGHEGRAVLEENIEPNWAGTQLVDRATMIGGYVVLAILLLLAIYLVVRYARRSSRKALQEDYLYEETEEELPPEKKKRGGSRRIIPTPADQVRAIYRKYLELMRENGVRVQKDSTSEEILDEAEQIRLTPAAQRLRELYLKARYAEGSQVTREDVQEASRCLKEIREDESWKK